MTAISPWHDGVLLVSDSPATGHLAYDGKRYAVGFCEGYPVLQDIFVSKQTKDPRADGGLAQNVHRSRHIKNLKIV